MNLKKKHKTHTSKMKDMKMHDRVGRPNHKLKSNPAMKSGK